MNNLSFDWHVAERFTPLKAIKPAHLEDLFSYSSLENICAGDLIFERDCAKREHIFLVHGAVQYAYASGFVEELSAEDCTGPLKHEVPRPCRCIALTDCTLLVIDSQRLDKALSWSQIGEYLTSELSMRRELDIDSTWIQTIIDSNLFFKIPPVNVEKIISAMTVQQVKTGEEIVRQGEAGDACYFIKSGKASVIRSNKDGQVIPLADIGEGRCFGEDALIDHTTRNATVTMTAGGELMVLAKSDFDGLLEEPSVEAYTEQELHRIDHPIIYIDVRTQAEYEEGHLVLSANMPLSILNLKKRILSKDKHYVFYCDSGRRSVAAAYLLNKDGLHASVIKDGLQGAGMQYQLVKDSMHIIKNGELVKA